MLARESSATIFRLPNSEFSQRLAVWYERVHRDLPWRRTSDPYAIWVSEIMLQQTRVATVVPYYERFLERFPTLEALAGAGEQDLLTAWAGLGYYSRVRNMQRAARQMAGTFPRDYESILSLPGIGAYTGAAVASIAFGLPRAAVDGNVLRVLSRTTNESGDIRSVTVKQRLQAVADQLLDRADPGRFNQAVMELGATVCLPRKPLCLVCPVQDLCEGRRAGRQDELPVKGRQPTTLRVDREVFLIERDGAMLLWQRPADSSLLAGFWELPEPEHLTSRPADAAYLGSFRHGITNHSYTFSAFLCPAQEEVYGPCKNVVKWAWMTCEEAGKRAISTTVRKAFALYRRSR